MPAPDARRPLNAFDQSMLSINITQQQDGNAGFETLAQLWLETRLEVSRLRLALDQLTTRHPVLTAHLTRAWNGIWRWDWSAGGSLKIEEQTLPDATESAVLTAAGELLSRPRNLRTEAPLNFHLLHLSDGSDVLLMHFNHVLIDLQSASLLLQELNGLLSGEAPLPAAPFIDRIAEHRRRFPRSQRWRAFRRILPEYVKDRWSPRDTWPRMIPSGQLPRSEFPARMKIIARELPATELQDLQQYARKASRLPSLSMCILGGVFAAVGDQVPGIQPTDLLRTCIGVDVTQQTLKTFQPQNVCSILRVELTREQSLDRTERVMRLNEQMHQTLRDQIDLGIIESSSLFYYCFPMVKREAGQMIRWAFSFWYAHTTAPPGLQDRFAGIPLRQFQYISPAWSPLGVAVLATQANDRLRFVLTYVEQQISAAQAQTLLDGILAELHAMLQET